MTPIQNAMANMQVMTAIMHSIKKNPDEYSRLKKIAKTHGINIDAKAINMDARQNRLIVSDTLQFWLHTFSAYKLHHRHLVYTSKWLKQRRTLGMHGNHSGFAPGEHGYHLAAWFKRMDDNINSQKTWHFNAKEAGVMLPIMFNFINVFRDAMNKAQIGNFMILWSTFMIYA